MNTALTGLVQLAARQWVRESVRQKETRPEKPGSEEVIKHENSKLLTPKHQEIFHERF